MKSLPLLLSTVFFAAASLATAQTQTPSMNASLDEVAVIQTDAGEMIVAFWPEVAPKTVENFKKLAKQGFYDGTAFHRIVKGFMIQGGDPLSKNDDPRVGTGGPGYQIKAEFNAKPHVRGVISMARSADPNSAGSQFFICLADARFLDRQYTAFGQLVKGDEVLGKIGDTPTTVGGGGEKSRPVTRVGVKSIKIVPAASAK
ncbi:MAG: peptidylprolyl isomerase [Verrucomicrobiae bacterium]|nr:peptidylprolyl isomerase [Verrucomicrobiae bacterium]